MTPQDLIAAFDTLAEAPDGVTRLRELVLQLAVRGKLVSQDPDDEPASALLQRIALEKAQLLADGTIRKTKKPKNDSIETPPEVPDSWETPLLDAIAYVVDPNPSHRNPAYLLSGFPFISTQEFFGRDGLVLETPRRVTEQTVMEQEARCRFNSRSIAFSRKGTIGKTRLLPATVRFALLDSLCVVNPSAFISERYLNHALRSGVVGDQITLMTRGLALRQISVGRLRLLRIPVPPYNEQKRIVERVDELMGLLDRLEAARNAREATRSALRDAALAALRDADTPEEVEVAWERIAGQMHDLFTDPADVDPLRQTVLQLAVRGRLVPQNPNDEPASVLLERIAEEKAQLVKDKKIRKPKVLAPVSEDEEHYSVPDSWSWARMDTCCTHIVDCLHRTPQYVEQGYPAIRTADVVPGRLLVKTARRVSEATFREQIRRLAPQSGDILYSREGERLGIAAQVPPGLTCCLSQRMAHLRPSKLASATFVMWFMNSPSGYGAAVGKVNQTTSPHVNMASIRAMVVPLPPVAEQERIVSRIDELMGLLHRLAQHLAKKTTAHDSFAAAAVHHLDA